MKTYTYTASCWQGYVNEVKEALKRVLTKEECSALMKSYINGLPVKAAIKKLKGA